MTKLPGVRLHPEVGVDREDFRHVQRAAGTTSRGGDQW